MSGRAPLMYARCPACNLKQALTQASVFRKHDRYVQEMIGGRISYVLRPCPGSKTLFEQKGTFSQPSIFSNRNED